MNNNYISLTRALQNNNFYTPNSVINRNNIINNTINSDFLDFPKQTRNTNLQPDLLNQSQVPVQYVNQAPIQYQSQFPVQYVNQAPFQYQSQNPVQYVIPVQYVNQIPIQYVVQNQVPIQNQNQVQNMNYLDLEKKNKPDILENKPQITENKLDILENKIDITENKPDILENKPQTSVEFNELKNNLDEIKRKLDNLPQNTPVDIDCDKKINIVKVELLDKINKINDKNKDTKNNYIDDLFELLLANEVLTRNEINNIKKRLNTNEIDQDTIITYLENKKKLTKQLQFNQYRNTNNYNDVLTGKWQVPMPRPPVCINNTEINAVNQYDPVFNNYSKFK